LTLLVD
jgi:hypothetical protein